MSITVYAVICSGGDGSSAISWFKNTSLEQLEELAERDPETWGSGEGLQYQELTFPDDFDFQAAGILYWDDDEIGSDY